MHKLSIGAAAILALALPAPVFAHAFLDHAVPGVGATLSGAPSDIDLTFTQEIVGALSGVKVTSAGGATVPASKPVVSGDTMHVHLGRPLAAGVYVVHWHVVSVDTHPTSGTFKFTVSP